MYKLHLSDINNYNSNNKILVLDFDLTITDIHTKGRIIQNKSYWYSKDNLNLLVNCLKKFKNLGWIIYIVSRGIKDDIKQYLTNLNIIELFDDILGSNSIKQVRENSFTWAKYKTQYLDNIITINNGDKNNLYFIDDTQENITFAKSSGYYNSIQLTNIGVSSIMLLSILEKILIDE